MRFIATVLIAAAAAAGCSSAPEKAPADPAEPGGRALTVDAFGSSPQVAAERPVSAEEFLEKVDKLLRAGRKGAAERLIRRFPDAALQALSEVGVRPAPALPSIAQVYERQCGTGAGGWPDLLRDRSEHLEAFKDFDQERAFRMRYLREGRFLDAADVDLSVIPAECTAGLLLKVELWKLRGLSLLLGERPADAAAAFRTAADAARVSRPYEAGHLLLLLGEAEQRSGRAEAAAKAWTEATEKLAMLSMDTVELLDPGFWERAIHLKPTTASWSPRVVTFVQETALRRVGVKIATDPDAEAGLWGLVGIARLHRGENRGALMAFSRGSGSGSIDDKLRECLKIGQAKALARQGELAAAKALLAGAAAKSGPTAIPALSLLGALELRSNDAARGLIMLKKALEDPAAPEWPWRAEAEANYGLALLSTGKETEGLKWLRQAQNRFEAERDTEGHVQSLRNELRYLEDHAKDREAVEVRDKLRPIE